MHWKRTAREVLARARISLLATDRIHDLAGDRGTMIAGVERREVGEWNDGYSEEFYELTLKNGQRFLVRFIVVEAKKGG